MSEIYITAAFRTSVEYQAFIFMKNEFVTLDYAPNGQDDKILYGPARLSELPSLKDTIFSDGIDCAFGSHDSGEAYIFAWNNCAKWVYPSYSTSGHKTTSDKIVEGPMPIERMFPFLKGTVFEDGVDAAFESSFQYEAFLFKGDKYARINYGPDADLCHYRPLLEYWPIFKGTVFDNGFDAAFASHLEREVYLFKGDLYVRIKFNHGQTRHEIFGSATKIKTYWYGIGPILPRKSCQDCQLID